MNNLTPNDFSDFPNLASARFGAETLCANDEFFAPKENLLKPEPPVFIPDKYTDRGKWMDGWETRRRRTPGDDWVVIQLAYPGMIHGIDVETTHFVGNYPESCSLEGVNEKINPKKNFKSLKEKIAFFENQIDWKEILPQFKLQGNTHNFFVTANRDLWTHIRLRIYPDGGVARLRVYGEAVPDWSKLSSKKRVDLAGLQNGGRVIQCSDMTFSPKNNLILPDKPKNMGDGWETKRRRGPGHDWVLVKLGTPGIIHEVEIDTTFFKGNAPGSCSLVGSFPEQEGYCTAQELTQKISVESALLPQTPLKPHHLHKISIKNQKPSSYVWLHIYPDGGVSRLRVYGTPVWDYQKLTAVNQMKFEGAVETFLKCCGAMKWASQMTERRPYWTYESFFHAAEELFDTLEEKDWLEAFSQHPKIGDLKGTGDRSGWAKSEQSGVAEDNQIFLDELAQKNKEYAEKFGFIYIVCASGLSGEEMLHRLKKRLENDRESELRTAAQEQKRITILRLEKLLRTPSFSAA
jgi:allantoicase